MHALPFADFVPIAFFGLVGLLIIGVAIIMYRVEKRRCQAIQALAGKLNLRYLHRDGSLPSRYEFLNEMDQGEDRYAFNVLEGVYKEHPILAFDYHYETHSTDSKGHRTTEHHYLNYVILEQPLDLPELRIYPENLLSKIGQMLGYADIDFESGEFSRAFTVRSADKKFAYDICHARMMEYLLAHRDFHIEIQHHCLALHALGKIKPEALETQLDQIVQIRQLFPEYLYRT